jgi:uncharacterized OB-fold protein
VTEIERILPPVNALTAPYWAAAREHRFVLPRCASCKRFHFYPRSVCPHCRSPDIMWKAASGAGQVYSYTVVHRAPSPTFAQKAPYIVAVVALAEGPHMMTRLDGVAPEAVRIGMRVQVDFEDATDSVSLPIFRPAAAK